MPIAERLQRYINRAKRSRLVLTMLDVPIVRATMRGVPGISGVYSQGWRFKHPIDRYYKIDTSGYVDARELVSSPFDEGHGGYYAGSQPSIIRRALKALPPLERFTFVDLGCGKGRPLVVASEFAFRDIVGVELTESLVHIASGNVAKIKQRFPERVQIRLELHDATTFNFPGGDLVIFLYNPFPAIVVTKLVKRLEALLRPGGHPNSSTCGHLKLLHP